LHADDVHLRVENSLFAGFFVVVGCFFCPVGFGAAGGRGIESLGTLDKLAAGLVSGGADNTETVFSDVGWS
jgi:hypothetical protein